MPRYKYRLENGVVYDLQYVDDDYVAQPNEILANDDIPSPDTLGKLKPDFVPGPTVQDIINALPPQAQAAIAAAVNARGNK